MNDEAEVRRVLDRIDRAWQKLELDGLDACFHEDAVIVGPGCAEYARGRAKCAESYREFATHAKVSAYAESNHVLRVFESTAIFTFAWEMTYRREGGDKREAGTDQLVLQRRDDRWEVVFRCISFSPA